MKKIAILLTGLFLLTVSIESVNAQSSATVPTAVANALIVTPITLSNNETLEFGEIVKSASGGDVIITASGTPTRTPSGDLTFMPSDVWRPSKFTVTGDDAETFSITKPANITLNGPSSSSMIITTSISGSITGVSTSSNSYVFYIGGTLPVASDQTVGAYTGTYEVTVQYE